MIRQWSNDVVWYLNIFDFWAWNNSMISSDNCFTMRLSNPIDKWEKSATTSDESILLWPPLTKVSSRDHLWRKYQTNSLTSSLDSGRNRPLQFCYQPPSEWERSVTVVCILDDSYDCELWWCDYIFIALSVIFIDPRSNYSPSIRLVFGTHFNFSPSSWR